MQIHNRKSIVFCLATALLLVCSFESTAQYDVVLYKRLTKEKSLAKTPAQKLGLNLELADYHTMQSLLKGYRKSADTAINLLKESEKLASQLRDEKAKGKIATKFSKVLDFELRYEESVEYAKKAIAILEKQSDKKLLADAYIALYNSYRYLNPTEKTIEMGEKVVEVALESKDGKIIGKAYENLAESHSVARDTEKTMVNLEKARYHYDKGGVKDQKSLYAFYGMMYTSQLEHAKAFRANLKAVEIIEKNKIEDYYNVTIYYTIANMYRDMQRYDIAISYLKKAYATLERYDLPRHHVILGRILSHCYYKQGMLAEAEKCAQTAERWHPIVDDAYKEMALITIFDTYAELGKPERASKYEADALAIVDADGPRRASLGTLSYALGKYYFAMKKYALAQKRIRDGLDVFEPSPLRFKMYEPYMLMYKIDSIKGDFASAAKSLRKAMICKDSMGNLAKNYQVAELGLKYDTEKKDKDNLLLKKQSELQKATLLKTETLRNISLAGVLLLAIVIFVIYRKFRITQRLRKLLANKNLELEEILEDKDVLLNEKEWLLKEIHHRVKNNLQIVMSLLNSQSHFLSEPTAKRAIENSQHRIHSMSLIHKKLYQSDNIAKINMSVYFSELMEYYKVAFDTEGRVGFQLDVDPIELESSQAVPIGLILNETVNNALKHAFPDNRQGNIRIALKNTGGNMAELRVADNGIGYSAFASDNGASLGMKLIRGFAKDLQGNLSFNSTDGLEVVVKFAVRSEEWGKIVA